MNGETNGNYGANGTDGHPPAITSTVEEFLARTYDFVIIGGGTAGLTLAARLTENPDTTVGVIEAGKNRLGDPYVDTPALFLQTLGNPEYDWMMSTTPQDANKGKVHHMPRGKLLGGSSGINYMMYVRGSNADYDDWATLVDDPSWSSENMKQYMRKHQTLEPIDESITDRSTMAYVGSNHGTSGPVRTSFNDWRLPIEDDIIKACDEATGMTNKPVDPWSGDHIGFFNTLGSVCRTGPNRGKRSYAARGYFEPNKARPNLKVLCEALATSIVLEGSTATGVSFRHGGDDYTVKANREVIVSGGAVLSPQILELSGIGDPKVLEAAGVECKIALPGVGNNFQDHVLSIACYELTPGNMSLDAIYNPDVMADAQKTLMEKAGGPLTCISSSQGFFSCKLFLSEAEVEDIIRSIEEIPDQTDFQQKQREQVIAHIRNPKSANLQFVLVAATAGSDEGVADQSKLFPPADPSKPMGITLAICLQYPVSRGSVHITSSDPTQPPVIDPAYLQHPADVAVLAAGMRFLDKVANSKALEGKLGRRITPRPELDLQKTEDAQAAVRDWVLGEYHPCGSCAMGDVVDSRLKVKGVEGLRVVDASVFPNHVSGNIVSSVYAVAEKAADIIKADYDYAPLAKVAA
ncbi:hypothetical protein H2201_004396 [Coniosporium apollinis]|uniref:Glucose-methanol-choline oxidoreductase N-terminal domain-containing protein n=1 Tax=Coniosporium apollinis TaxID=61459 RepID=A0ABQ9NSX6_9PEZI|nr:hypothetical protein H2201_004396 [Coniosporium apollinis]